MALWIASHKAKEERIEEATAPRPKATVVGYSVTGQFETVACRWHRISPNSNFAHATTQPSQAGDKQESF